MQSIMSVEQTREEQLSEARSLLARACGILDACASIMTIYDTGKAVPMKIQGFLAEVDDWRLKCQR